MPNVIRNVRSGDRDVDALLIDNKWATPSLTFSFPTRISQWSDGYGPGEEPYDNFEALNATQRGVVADVLTEISSVANLSFELVWGGAGDLRFGMSDIPETAHAYTPTSAPWGGDSWYNNSGRDYDHPVRGNYAYHTFIHEIGHALGLKHPHETDMFGAMSASRDSMEFTVMSYRSYPRAPIGDDGGYTNESWGFAQSLMMYDIAALQHMYGANFAANAGDTVYGWSSVTGELSIDGVGQGAPGANRVFMTIWDGGGIDTYDLSGYATALSVDLRPGQWVQTSDVQRVNLGEGHQARGNIANALLYNDDPRSLIENVVGGNGDDRFVGNAGANRLLGGAGNDSFDGLGGNDHIDGGGGADGMEGGAGNDTYVVDHAGDRVTETSGNGRDTVRSSISFALPGAVETLILTGADAIAGRGNDAANRIVGNAGANILNGRGGNDVMVGGGGNDIYIANASGDRALEEGAGGVDRVKSSVSFALRAHVENLGLTGNGDINGHGNGLANRINGNVGDNIIHGRGGADRMSGGDGNDLYYVDDAGDRAFDASASGGTDRVKSAVDFRLSVNVENLGLTGTGAADGSGNNVRNRINGNAAANGIDGRGGSDVLNGRAGDDSLRGAVGDDVLQGGAGADGFYFDVGFDVAGVDDILDFSSADDTLFLDGSVFKAIDAGQLSADAFHAGASAQDAQDRIVYNEATGRIFYDADGSGGAAAILFASVDPGTDLTHADFSIYP